MLDELRSELAARIEQQGTGLETNLRRLATDLQQQGQDLRSEFSSALSALQDEKTNRHDLGDLLMEMGMRLKQEGDLSDLLDRLEATAAEQLEE